MASPELPCKGKAAHSWGSAGKARAGAGFLSTMSAGGAGRAASSAAAAAPEWRASPSLLKQRRALCGAGQRFCSHTSRCLDDRNDFKFPLNFETMMKMNKTQRICFHHVMTTQILNVFVTRRSFAEWDHTRLSKLISSLHESLTDLKEKKYSSCAWEVVLVEVMARVVNLLLSLKKSQQIQNKFIW